MPRSEVYSWRLAPDTKAALEEAASRDGVPVAAVLDRIVGAWRARAGATAGASVQAALRARARACFGALRGGRPDRSERVRDVVRARLGKRRAR